MSAHARSERCQPETASVTCRAGQVWTICLQTNFIRCFMSLLQDEAEDGRDDRIDIYDQVDQVPAIQRDPQAQAVRHGSQNL
jgi:hypothetical protein